ncbi:MAG TPA: flagellar basal body L-ring protein FlgH [Mesorhizobium sp.]|jgi:flagellar L-ring protein precursor FlgH|nr:flagellar basal body L-ring protein FlgH [Mesorhizobium sp.]
MKPLLLALSALLISSGCASRQQLAEIGREPALSPVGSGIDPGVSAVSLEDYPKAPASPVKRFSLWDDRQSRLFTDPRALRTGDILTVKIRISDRAKLQNESERSRTASRSLEAEAGFDWDFIDLPSGSLEGSIGSGTSTGGEGSIARSENIDLLVAAVVTDVLPNGNLAIRGSQEVRVNAELRVLTIAGIVRPKDIGAENTISYERIAEARISYGGRGRLTEVQQPPYGQQVLDTVLPF